MVNIWFCYRAISLILTIKHYAMTTFKQIIELKPGKRYANEFADLILSTTKYSSSSSSNILKLLSTFYKVSWTRNNSWKFFQSISLSSDRRRHLRTARPVSNFFLTKDKKIATTMKKCHAMPGLFFIFSIVKQNFRCLDPNSRPQVSSFNQMHQFPPHRPVWWKQNKYFHCTTLICNVQKRLGYSKVWRIEGLKGRRLDVWRITKVTTGYLRKHG